MFHTAVLILFPSDSENWGENNTPFGHHNLHENRVWPYYCFFFVNRIDFQDKVMNFIRIRVLKKAKIPT